MTAIWWVRRDLRLEDNQALAAALEAGGGATLPVFVLDPRLLHSPAVGERRTAFLYEGLAALDGELRARGSRLLLRRGDPAAVLPALAAEVGAPAVCAEADASPYAAARDRRVAAALAPLPLHLTPGVTISPLGAVRAADGRPYTVYAPFRKRWKAGPLPRRGDLLPAPDRLAAPPAAGGEPLPTADGALLLPQPAGPAAAQAALERFVAGPIYAYAAERSQPALDATSHLSPYLRFGMLSPRAAAVAALEALWAGAGAAGPEKWLDELLWREFFLNILHHFPHSRTRSFRPAYDTIAWENDPAAFAAWCAGRTGYPIVDAAMRQLVETGWLHNRARMIAASFLVKDLLVDWRQGERFFMQHLVDADPASNVGNWQWVAGAGASAAPYFRFFNPAVQGQRYDPQGSYVRRWLPELAGVPDEQIHTPWKMSPGEQRRARCTIGVEYPAPLVEHTWARARALAAYRTRGAAAQAES